MNYILYGGIDNTMSPHEQCEAIETMAAYSECERSINIAVAMASMYAEANTSFFGKIITFISNAIKKIIAFIKKMIAKVIDFLKKPFKSSESSGGGGGGGSSSSGSSKPDTFFEFDKIIDGNLDKIYGAIFRTLDKMSIYPNKITPNAAYDKFFKTKFDSYAQTKDGLVKYAKDLKSETDASGREVISDLFNNNETEIYKFEGKSVIGKLNAKRIINIGTAKAFVASAIVGTSVQIANLSTLDALLDEMAKNKTTVSPAEFQGLMRSLCESVMESLSESKLRASVSKVIGVNGIDDCVVMGMSPSDLLKYDAKLIIGKNALIETELMTEEEIKKDPILGSSEIDALIVDGDKVKPYDVAKFRKSYNEVPMTIGVYEECLDAGGMVQVVMTSLNEINKYKEDSELSAKYEKKDDENVNEEIKSMQQLLQRFGQFIKVANKTIPDAIIKSSSVTEIALTTITNRAAILSAGYCVDLFTRVAKAASSLVESEVMTADEYRATINRILVDYKSMVKLAIRASVDHEIKEIMSK